jgi:hypothetical protein
MVGWRFRIDSRFATRELRKKQVDSHTICVHTTQSSVNESALRTWVHQIRGGSCIIQKNVKPAGWRTTNESETHLLGSSFLGPVVFAYTESAMQSGMQNSCTAPACAWNRRHLVGPCRLKNTRLQAARELEKSKGCQTLLCGFNW